METSENAGQVVRASIMAQIQREAALGKKKLPSRYSGEAANRNAAPSSYNLFIPIRGDRHLVYNTLTGAYAIWDADDMEIYESLKYSDRRVSDPELRDFIGAGFMVSDATDEVAELEQRYMGARQDPGTMVMTIAPIMACNFACDYCFQGANKPHKKMTPEVQDALLDYLDRKLPELNNLSISWYGGEPLMGKDTIEALTHRINELCIKHKVNYSAFIVTNGYFLNGDMAEKLVKLGVTSCQVTLDGNAESHDARRYLLSGRPTYDRIAKNLVEVVDRTNMQVSLRVNIDHHNKDNIKQLLQDLSERGLARRNTLGVYFAPVESITEACHGTNETAMGKTEYAIMEADLYRYAFELGLTGLPRPPMMHGNCAAVRTNGLVLLPTGELHKCWDTVNDTRMKIGTIFEPEKAFQSQIHEEWMNWSPFNNDTCRSCKILPNCTGACAFKFIHKDKTLGEGGSLPCPSWKFNINERLLIRAEKKGIISAEDIIEESATSADQVGQNHSTSGLFRVAATKEPELSLAIT
ncbi:radical SAM/SPASM domain protein maturase [Hwanghaeella grinnelliae]|uniref:Radical SAM/SPASM domain protein maturase n=1 Tax=Hwanghaeella grinnelliae TaxID=2500179 RepID=A0A437QHC4_9PROT|nr:TIGR04463 family radical SAM/SPASM RiPP maturase [Hwanghaeella grinnelliae]RVU33967.1 radical SAM/SPASM domain protein maturase [Hwanghaeella grinnelliae]